MRPLSPSGAPERAAHVSGTRSPAQRPLGAREEAERACAHCHCRRAWRELAVPELGGAVRALCAPCALRMLESAWLPALVVGSVADLPARGARRPSLSEIERDGGR